MHWSNKMNRITRVSSRYDVLKEENVPIHHRVLYLYDVKEIIKQLVTRKSNKGVDAITFITTLLVFSRSQRSSRNKVKLTYLWVFTRTNQCVIQIQIQTPWRYDKGLIDGVKRKGSCLTSPRLKRCRKGCKEKFYCYYYYYW